MFHVENLRVTVKETF